MNNIDQPKQPTTSNVDYLMIMLVVSALGVVLGPPIWQNWMSGASSAKPIPVGTVQRIQYIGNLGIDTQIDTNARSFMVSGISKLQKGMLLNLHHGFGSRAVCNADQSICERLMGSD
jgi:hypothetical protein